MSNDTCNYTIANIDDVREHEYDFDVNQELCPKKEQKQELMMEDTNLTAPPKVRGGVYGSNCSKRDRTTERFYFL